MGENDDGRKETDSSKNRWMHTRIGAFSKGSQASVEMCKGKTMADFLSSFHCNDSILHRFLLLFPFSLVNDFNHCYCCCFIGNTWRQFKYDMFAVISLLNFQVHAKDSPNKDTNIQTLTTQHLYACFVCLLLVYKCLNLS